MHSMINTESSKYLTFSNISLKWPLFVQRVHWAMNAFFDAVAPFICTESASPALVIA
jgi:hypothetical protein